ncbi:unnamed protein product [Plutella xylostella]|uniref:(diamondback moth) hypothetical protein n=1 Tax=Plutella xylostella TaxID=51655 RepID=A0A8S4G380_PLUXY|nr:unnamed protein product [Plutella xylostella]
MVQAGGVAPLVAALDRDDCADLQFEAAWALTNIASGSHDHTMAVVDGGAIPKLVLLLSRGGAVGEQSAWALGNIAGDGPETRDAVLARGALPALLPSLVPAAPRARLNTAVWTYSNLCRDRYCSLGNIAGDGPETRDAVLARGALPALLPSLVPAAPRARLNTAVWTYSNLCRNKNPLVDFELVAPALPYISELLTIEDQDALADACWALSYLTDGPNDRIEAVQTTPGLLPRLVALLEHRSAAVKTPALRAVGNMLTGSDVQKSLFAIRPPLASALVEIALGGKSGRIEAVQTTPGLLPRLVALLEHRSAAVKTPALRAVGNMLTGSDVQVWRLERLEEIASSDKYTSSV